MRDPKRIDPIMESLTAVWKQNPDWRLTQLLVNTGIVPNFPGRWYYEEDDYLALDSREDVDWDLHEGL